jgi:hypothetical protein
MHLFNHVCRVCRYVCRLGERKFKLYETNMLLMCQIQMMLALLPQNKNMDLIGCHDIQKTNHGVLPSPYKSRCYTYVLLAS